MSSAFRRKTYGPVRPVPQPKPEKPKKPGLMELRRIYSSIAKSSTVSYLDHITDALHWWEGALKYVKVVRPTAKETAKTSRTYLTMQDWLGKGYAAKSNEEKERCFVAAIDLVRRFCEPILSAPPLAPSLAIHRENKKKFKEAVKKIAPKYDPFLTLIMQCFGSAANFTLEVVPTIEGHNDARRKFDHALSTIYYTRAMVAQMMAHYRNFGLLSVIVEEAKFFSRALAFVGVSEGKYIADPANTHEAYVRLMEAFVESLQSHPEYARKLVRKPSTRKPRKVKDTASTPPKPKLIRFKEKTIASSLLDELREKGMKAKEAAAQ